MHFRARNILRTLRASALRRSALRAGVAVVYHHIGETTGSRERELVPAHGRALFEAQLRQLAAGYRVVPPSQLHVAAAGRRRGEPFPVAITFDDDLPSHSRVAAPMLERHGLPAAFFLSGTSLTEPREFWWQQLQRLVDSDRADGALVGAVLAGEPPEPGGAPLVKVLARRIQAMTPERRAGIEQLLERAAGPAPADAGLRAADVRVLASAGFEIGFHTVRHHVLPPLNDTNLAAALSAGREELEAVAGRPLTAISYPHGRANARVAGAARRAGFAAGFTGRPESVRPDGDPLLMGRVEPSFESASELETQLERALAIAPGRGGADG
jgi:peptidoglycan/xylan/chitin deacetylase (PgdA/CDA1 family)